MPTATRTAPSTASAYPATWQVARTYQHGKYELVVGTMLRIDGESGWFTFYDHVVAPPPAGRRKPAEWVTVIDRSKTRGGTYRSFRPARIGTVTRTVIDPARAALARRENRLEEARRAADRARARAR